mgnify:FL=1
MKDQQTTGRDHRSKVPSSFCVNRSLNSESRSDGFPLPHIFHGLDYSPVVQSLFGGKESAAQTLRSVRVRFDDSAEYMYVDDTTGTIIVSKRYLQSASEELLYLDIIHELVHIKQYRDGQELFDSKFSYVDRPTELEAYRLTLDEARKIGMTDEEIEDYLYVEWITKKEHKRLARMLGIDATRKRRNETT